jgi:predicted amidohydrolase
VRIALLQVNPTAGDLKGNSSLILRAADASRPQAPDLAVTTELALMGYLPRDLLMNTGFVHRASETLAWMAAELRDGPPLLVGVATPNPSESLTKTAISSRPRAPKFSISTATAWASAFAKTPGTTAISGNAAGIIGTPSKCWRSPGLSLS